MKMDLLDHNITSNAYDRCYFDESHVFRIVTKLRNVILPETLTSIAKNAD